MSAAHAPSPDRVPLPEVTRPVTVADAAALADLLVANRDFLAPYEPDRGPAYPTVDGQAAAIADGLARQARGEIVPHVILDADADGAVVGRITLDHVIRGALQSATVGYWLAEDATGRGLASRALGEMVRIAFAELGLHRLQAGTLVDNVRSQRVLERAGFQRYGMAPRLLKIGGRWQDHVLYQLLNPAQE